MIYPFIVNNPGEAAAAKRRLGAVTIGHLTPPLTTAGSHGPAVELERLIDEYAAADGLDRRRGALLRREILDRAAQTGLLAESGIRQDAPDDEALARLDAYLCDVKDLQIRDGLHIFATAPRRRDILLEALRRASPAVPEATLAADLDRCADAEGAALLAALEGKFVAPGPAGAPTRGRADVLPTGRNLFTIDPRAVPTRSAVLLAEKAAADLLRRHRQDHGDWPRSVVIDLWGSASMRTGGEDLALALVLMGARPIWDDGSNRVGGIEILPLALLDRPRVDVTLRISGLFRDAFATQIALFDSAVRADRGARRGGGLEPPGRRRARAGGRCAAAGDHPRSTARRPAIMARALASRSPAGPGGIAPNSAPRIWPARPAPMAAGWRGLPMRPVSLPGLPGRTPSCTSRTMPRPICWKAPNTPRMRAVSPPPPRRWGQLRRCITPTPPARTRRAPALCPRRSPAWCVAAPPTPLWIAGMMRHGYRGAAEIARALDGLHAFSATLAQRFDAQFDLVFDATLGDPEVDRFLRQANPDARAAMAERFRDALRRDLWRPRRNTVAATLDTPEP